MVKRNSAINIALSAVLLAVLGAGGMALAKEKFAISYLPVDHDMDMIRKEYTSKQLAETSGASCSLAPDFVQKYYKCKKCTGLDAIGACPDCCLYNGTGAGNLTLIHCASNKTDQNCFNPGAIPFDSSCADCDNFPKDCACASNPSACNAGNTTNAPFECLTSVSACYKKGCPSNLKPDDPSCVPSAGKAGSWICDRNNIKSPKACKSNNSRIPDCEQYSQTKSAYDIAKVDCENPGNSTNTTAECWEYTPKGSYKKCSSECVQKVNQWEIDFNNYHCGMTGNSVCPSSTACKSGFSRNCNEAKCEERVENECLTKYTKDKCKNAEKEFRERFLAGEVSPCFKEIDHEFRYKFVARSNERYVVMWQVLCDVLVPHSEYNFYTMVKIFDENNSVTPVYESVIHEKALLSTFFINAQTGFEQEILTPGKSYNVRLYYFLPEGANLKMKVGLVQMIIYRTKN